jgi:MFS transporter, PAT family, beta-lactamase induction signal transducer AmpG
LNQRDPRPPRKSAAKDFFSPLLDPDRMNAASHTDVAKQRVPPVWLMGLSNASLGLYGGAAFFALPQLMAAQHVPETRIAAITAASISPMFWGILLGPMLDVRFTRRWYATLFAALESLAVMAAVLSLNHLVVLQIALLAGTAASLLSATALGGWLSTVCRADETNRLSAWTNIAVIVGTGVTSAAGSELVRHLPVGAAAALLGGMVFLPALIFTVIPCSPPDDRLAAESFRQFNRDILALLRRREVLAALLLFVAPCGSFALTYMLGGLGKDFGASPRMISFAGGVGAIVPGIVGCLFFPVLARRIPLRFLYLGNGIVGGLFTLSLAFIPHGPWTFLAVLLGEYLFQAVSFSTQVGIMFQTIGENNALAATTFTFLMGATSVPNTYMLLVNGRGYSMGGVPGTFATDALVGICACIVAGLLVRAILPAKSPVSGTSELQQPGAATSTD